MSKEVLLELKGLSKHFGSMKVVDNIDLQLFRGEVLGLVGESGSGKSTLGKLILGLHDKSSGEVLFAGTPLPKRYRREDFKRMAGAVQMVFQDPGSSLNPRMTVAEIIAEPLKFQSVDGNSRVPLERWLERVGLPGSSLSRYPHEFSGGQRQRIGIARALICEPELLICDEPISALDVSVQAQVVNLLFELRRELGLSLLFIAHDLAMVRYISDRVAVMYLGQLMEVASTDTLFQRPRHPYTQLLLASNPLPDPGQRNDLSATLKGTEPKATGCPFAPRCPKALSVCGEEMPLLKAVGVEHVVACHLL